MKCKELVALLQKMDQECEVFVVDPNNSDGFIPVITLIPEDFTKTQKTSYSQTLKAEVEYEEISLGKCKETELKRNVKGYLII